MNDNTSNITDNNTAFDITIAIYYWLSHWYKGKSCDKYVAMSILVGKHKLVIREELRDMTQIYYDEIDENNWKEKFKDLCNYLDNEWYKNRE